MKKVSQKELLKRSYKAILYARDMIDAMSEGSEVDAFEKGVQEILAGRKADEQMSSEAFSHCLKEMGLDEN